MAELNFSQSHPALWPTFSEGVQTLPSYPQSPAVRVPRPFPSYPQSPVISLHRPLNTNTWRKKVLPMSSSNRRSTCLIICTVLKNFTSYLFEFGRHLIMLYLYLIPLSYKTSTYKKLSCVFVYNIECSQISY